MTLKFKTVIFFSTENENTLKFKEELEKIKYIKIFTTNDVGEVQQIIDQSEKAVILVDHEVAENKLFRATLNKKKARFKKFYINWYLTMAKDLVEKLSERNITLIRSTDVESVFDRVEMYLFGKAKIFDNAETSPKAPASTLLLKKGYFSHLEKQDHKWKILISSHETDDEVSKTLGLNWDKHMESILASSADFRELTETRLESSQFHELIYPHIVDGQLKKISIVHLNLDDNFVTTVVSIHKFLQSL